VGPHVSLGQGVVLHSHACVRGTTDVGAYTEIHLFAVVGGPAQTVPADRGPARLTLGTHNTIREHVTIHGGTGDGETRIGDHNTFMVGAHVAHDCVLGNHIVAANETGISGHCQVGDFVFFGGKSACHQYVRVGESAMLGGNCHAFEDVLPFTLVKYSPARTTRVNSTGLSRRGFSAAQIATIDHAVSRILDGGGDLERLVVALLAEESSEHVMQLARFVAESRRGIAPRPLPAGGRS